MTGAVFAAANRAPGTFGLNAPPLVDESTSYSCSTTSSSSGGSSTTVVLTPQSGSDEAAHGTQTERCDSDSASTCTYSGTSQGSTTTTAHLGEEHPLSGCPNESETSETETESPQSGGEYHQTQEITLKMAPLSVQ